MADLMPPREITVTGHEYRRGLWHERRGGRGTGASHGTASRTWVYHDDCEDAAGLILRWDREGGKEIRPVSRTREGWVLGGMPTPRPLYRLVELLKRREERVYVTEGEKAADAAGTLGLLATTSPHGAQSAAKADWRALAGRDVAILPDNDGRRAGATPTTWARILLGLEPPATVRIVGASSRGRGRGRGPSTTGWSIATRLSRTRSASASVRRLVEAAEE